MRGSKTKKAKPKNEDLTVDQEGILGRVAGLLGVRQDAEVAAALGVSPQTYSTWKARKTIPFARLCTLAQERNVSLDWLLLGRGGPSPAGAAIDAELFERIFRAAWDGYQELPGPISVNFVVASACRIYGKVSAVVEPAQRSKLLEEEVNHSLAALAYAMAAMLRRQQTADSRAEPGDSAEAERLEQLGAKFEARASSFTQRA